MFTEEIKKILNLFLEYLSISNKDEQLKVVEAAELKIYCDLLMDLEGVSKTPENRLNYIQKIGNYSDGQINDLLSGDVKRTMEILARSVNDTFSDILAEGNQFLTEQQKLGLKSKLEKVINDYKEKDI